MDAWQRPPRFHPTKIHTRANHMLDLAYSDDLEPLEEQYVHNHNISSLSLTTASSGMSIIPSFTNPWSLTALTVQSKHWDQFKKLYVFEHCGRKYDSWTNEAKLKVLRTGIGGEVQSSNFEQYLIQNCIHQKLTAAVFHSAEWVSEGMNRTLALCAQ